MRTVGRERGIHFRHDAVAALQHDEADLVATDSLVKRRDFVDKGGQLAEKLYSDESSADDHERKQFAFALWIGLDRGPLKAFDDLIAKQQGIGKRLEGECVLGARNH